MAPEPDDVPVLDYASPQSRQRKRASRPATLCACGSVLSLGLSIPLAATQAFMVFAALGGLLAVATIVVGARARFNPDAGDWWLGSVMAGVFLLVASAFLVHILYDVAWVAQRQQRDRQCAANLATIYVALTKYMGVHGSYPDHLVRLIETQNMTPAAFVCPDCGDHRPAKGATPAAIAADFMKPGRCSYKYAATIPQAPWRGDIVLLYEPLTNHHTAMVHVLWGDGTVERWFDRSPFACQITALEATTRPASGAANER